MNSMTTSIIEIALTCVGAVVASSGFWMFIMKRTETKSMNNQLLMGLAHDRIMYLGMKYIERGWISRDEYENLHDYLYKPYLALGGNGSGNRVMCEIEKLPIRDILSADKEKSKNEDV